MVTRSRARRILAIGLPIVGGMLSQNVLDLVDTLMVGRLGAAALAAVGIASFANFMGVALLIGLASGVQAVVARRRGEGRLGELAIPLNGGLAVALAGGLLVTAVGITLAPTIYPWLVDFRPDVIAEGVPYFQARLAGAVAVGLNFSFRGYWYGLGETRTYLRIIVAMHLANIAISYVLIFGPLGLPALGTLGAGVGTTLALFIGTTLYSVATFTRSHGQGFLARLPRGKTMRSLMSLSIPGAIQTFLFAAGLTALFWIAAQVGTGALAISNVLFNLAKVAILPAMGLGLAAMTLVSGALGEGEPAIAERWAWDTLQVAVAFVLAVAAILYVFPAPILSVFITDPALVEAGIVPLRIQAVALAAEIIAMVMMNALVGAGAARTAMLVNVSAQWLVGLPLAFVLAVPLGHGVVGLWLAQALQRIAAAGVFTALWRRGRWKTIEL